MDIVELAELDGVGRVEGALLVCLDICKGCGSHLVALEPRHGETSLRVGYERWQGPREKEGYSVLSLTQESVRTRLIPQDTLR